MAYLNATSHTEPVANFPNAFGQRRHYSATNADTTLQISQSEHDIAFDPAHCELQI
jgi:hypothetical protein